MLSAYSKPLGHVGCECIRLGIKPRNRWEMISAFSQLLGDVDSTATGTWFLVLAGVLTAWGAWLLVLTGAGAVVVAWRQLTRFNDNERLKFTLDLLRRYDRERVPFVHAGKDQAITPAVAVARSNSPEGRAFFENYD